MKAREWWICMSWHQNGGSSVEKTHWASLSKPALEKNVGGLKIGNFIHVREVLPDTVTITHEQLVTAWYQTLKELGGVVTHEELWKTLASTERGHDDKA